MYKFEISADSPDELRQKMSEFAKEFMDDEAPYGDEPLPVEPARLETIANEMYPPTVDQALSVVALRQIEDNINRGPAISVPKTTPIFPGAALALPTIDPNAAVDSRGIPWDERIHASSKSFNKDGSWRTRRGVSDQLVRDVEAQLKSIAKGEAMTPRFVPQVPGIVAAPILNVSPFGPPVQVPAHDTPPPVDMTKYQEVQIPQGTRPAHTLVTFKNNLMDVINQLVREGKIDQNYIASLNAYYKQKNDESIAKGQHVPPHVNIWNVLGVENNARELWEKFAECGFITAVEG